MLIDRPVEIRPLARDLHVSLVGEPPVTRSAAARPGSLDELRGEPLHPPVDSDVIDGDTALGQQLFQVPAGRRPGPSPCPGDRWFVGETHLKVAGKRAYLYRAVDQHGQV